MLIYVSSHANTDALFQTRRRIFEAGHYCLCPVLDAPEFQVDLRLNMLSRCDALLLDSTAESGYGMVQAEYDFALANDIPVLIDQLPPAHPTEVACPQQTQAFMVALMRAYRLHLDKHADYGNAGYLGTGEFGIVTRLWEKVTRIMNLYGFRFDISNPRMESPKFPLNEAVEKTWEDLIVYPIVAMLLRRGQWGK